MSDEELGVWVDASTQKALDEGGLWTSSGTREEIIYQERVNALWIDVDGDRQKFNEGIRKIGDEAGLVLDIMSFPLGVSAVSARANIKTGQYVIRNAVKKPKISASNSAKKLPSNSKLKVSDEVINKVPESFKSPMPNRKGGEGYRWFDNANKGNSVRIDKGNPSNSQVRQQVDHVIINNNGKIIGRNGEPIKGTIKDNWDQAHIPLKEYEKWNKWNSPK